MAFGNKELTKEDLQKAGLDPDKLKEFQEKGVTKDDLTAMKEALKTELGTTITDQIKAGFTDLETRLRPKEPAKKTNADGTPIEEDVDDQTRFLTDPAKFVKDEVNNLRGQAAVEIMKTRRDIALRDAMTNLKGFGNQALKDEIMKELDEKYDALKMVRYGSDPVALIKSVHDMILGRHQDEIIQDTNKKDGKYNLVHSGGGSHTTLDNNRRSHQDDPSKRELTEEEKVVAKKFGMTEDEWRQQGIDSEKEEQARRKGGTVLV